MTLVYCICPKCDFDMVVERRERAYWCPLCAGDNGRDIVMQEHPVSTAPSVVEGRDGRK